MKIFEVRGNIYPVLSQPIGTLRIEPDEPVDISIDFFDDPGGDNNAMTYMKVFL